MKDIENRNDIDELMKKFYAKAIPDEVIGYFFTDVTKMDIINHLPIIGDFWESILFDMNKYNGDPMKIHQKINHLSQFKKEHFERWIMLFTSTVNEMFEGEMAERAKQRARSIATVMKIKLVYGGIIKK
ncbi:MAG: group III truncated hemoglobin [Chitinophagaceae bacterium]